VTPPTAMPLAPMEYYKVVVFAGIIISDIDR